MARVDEGGGRATGTRAQGGDERHAAHRRNGSPGNATRTPTPDAAPDRTATPPRPVAPGTLSRRLLWFGGLWLAGVATVSIVAYAIRSVIMP